MSYSKFASGSIKTKNECIFFCVYSLVYYSTFMCGENAQYNYRFETIVANVSSAACAVRDNLR